MRSMQDRGYLLNVAELDATQARILEKLDAARRSKLNTARTAQRKRACAGAGLLIQWALQETLQLQETQGLIGQGGQSGQWQMAGLQEGQCAQEPGVSVAGSFLRELVSEELLLGLGEPLEISFRYGDRGKPYFKDFPLFFNLSHSGDYVICVLSEREIGVDIQKQKPVDVARIGRRFFHEREQNFLAGLSGEAQRMEWFYRLWTRKEAYGKMTGDGLISTADSIAGAVSRDFVSLDADWLQGTNWQEYGFLDGYQIACCVRGNNTCYDC